jgi:hypothetical protein
MLQYDRKQELMILFGFGKPDFNYLSRNIIKAKKKRESIEKQINYCVQDISRRRHHHSKNLVECLALMGTSILFDDFVMGGGLDDPIDYTEIKKLYSEEAKLVKRLNKLEGLAKQYHNKTLDIQLVKSKCLYTENLL